jgi:HD-like signal output (HDOD) protein
MELLFSKIKQLPVIPKLLHELMQDFSNDNAQIQDIAHKIAMDQVISAKVLKLANSAVQKLPLSNKPLFVLALTHCVH